MRDIETMTHRGGASLGAPASHTHSVRLGGMRRGARGTIVGISPRAARASDALEPAELERRLLEMGFVEGASVEILHEGPIGRDPIAVKVDETRVALRRRDADALVIAEEKESRAA